MRSLPYVLRAVKSRTGALVDLDTWAQWARIPHRGEPGRIVDGALMRDLLGIESKAWSPELFREPETVAALGRDALARTGWLPGDVDALVLVTCTPFELALDQDAHRLGRALALPDDVPVLTLHAGCAGLARAMAHLSRLSVRRALLLTWNSPGAYMTLPDGEPNPLYRDNHTHPSANLLWFSPALFSDGAAAATLERAPDPACEGRVAYTRDALSFAGGPPFHDPLVVFPGGGALHPPGSPAARGLSAFGMRGAAIQRYYTDGMVANGRTLEAAMPGYLDAVVRLYTHQASPRLVRGFLARAGLPPEKVPRNCERLGNLVSASTLCLLDDDVRAGRVQAGDRVCFSVVGAGPERGAFVLTYAG